MQDADHRTRKATLNEVKNSEKWEREVTVTLVKDLFKDKESLPKKWATFQAVVNQANKQHISLLDGSAPRQWKELALQIADSVVKSAKAAKFDFQTLQLRFPANGRTLLITKINGVLEAK